MADRPDPGRVRDQGLEEARPGDLGGPRQATALRVIEAHVLGGARPGGEAGRDPRRTEARGDLGVDRGRDQGRHPRARASTTACSASTTTPTPSTPRRCWRRSSASCPRTTSGCASPSRRSPTTSPRTGSSSATRPGETDDGLSGKEGSFLICSFWLVSALAIVGEQQRARDLMERLLTRRLAARALRRGVRHRAPAVTWATSRRRSRTWR